MPALPTRRAALPGAVFAPCRAATAPEWTEKLHWFASGGGAGRHTARGRCGAAAAITQRHPQSADSAGRKWISMGQSAFLTELGGDQPQERAASGRPAGPPQRRLGGAASQPALNYGASDSALGRRGRVTAS